MNIKIKTHFQNSLIVLDHAADRLAVGRVPKVAKLAQVKLQTRRCAVTHYIGGVAWSAIKTYLSVAVHVAVRPCLTDFDVLQARRC